MARTTLTCDNIGDLDGGHLRGVVNKLIRLVLSDIEDRGGDEQARKIKITLTMQKKDGLLTIEGAANPEFPVYRVNKTHAELSQRVTKGGVVPTLEFQEHNPDNAEQDTFKAMDNG
jgi:hypothetical protein